MRKNKWSKILSIFMALLLLLLPSYSSIANDTYTGLRTIDGKQRSYISGTLVKSAVSRVNDTLYYSDSSGNITAKIQMKTDLKYVTVENQKGYFDSESALNGVNSNSTVRPATYYVYKVVNGAFNITRVKGAPGFWIKAEDSQVNMRKQFDGMDLAPKTTTTTTTTTTTSSVGEMLSDGRFKLLKSVPGYVSAADALANKNSVNTKRAGTYYVYKTYRGALNISTVKGQAGSWINPGKLTTTVTQPAPTPTPTTTSAGSFLSDGRFKLIKSVPGYVSAADAEANRNPINTKRAATYYVYKKYNGMLNISTVKGQAGSWINPGKLTTPVTPPAPAPTPIETSVGTMLSDGRFKLLKSVPGYISASDAEANRNPINTRRAATYYVFKKYNGMLNISTVKGQAGSWINPGKLTTPVTPPTPIVKEPTPTTPTDTSVGTMLSDGRFKLTTSTPGYFSAADAYAKKNAVVTMRAATYYVYKKYNGMLNISTVSGRAGSWINPGKLTTTVTPPAPIVKEPVVDTKTPTDTQSGTSYKLVTSVPGYMSAADAMAARNKIVNLRSGSYYVYKSYNGALNITTVKGVAGSWINPKDNVIAPTTDTTAPTTDAKTPTTDTTKPVTEPKPEEPKRLTKLPVIPETGGKFVIAVDPGHGGGTAHNRGGVLFNEGDQNYKFAQLFIAEAKKYNNVVIKLTRPTQYSNPSLPERAAFGAGAHLFLSLHTNAMPITYSSTGQMIRNDNVRGVEVFSSNYSMNTKIAYDITSMVSNLLGTPNRGVKYAQYNGSVYRNPVLPNGEDYYGVFRYDNTAPTRLLIEFVFHTNWADSKAYLDNQYTLARKLMEVVARNYNLTK